MSYYNNEDFNRKKDIQFSDFEGFCVGNCGELYRPVFEERNRQTLINQDFNIQSLITEGLEKEVEYESKIFDYKSFLDNKGIMLNLKPNLGFNDIDIICKYYRDSIKKLLDYLSLGTNIPIYESFYKYMMYNFYFFNAKSIILLEGKNIIGHALIYYDNMDILFYGFFGVKMEYPKVFHDPDLIKALFKKIVRYGKENKFKILRGPINIPTFIFGWGFMDSATKLQTLFVSKPINPPVYQETLVNMGNIVTHTTETIERGTISKKEREALKKNKGGEWVNFEYFIPNIKNFDRDVIYYNHFGRFMTYQEIFLDLQRRLLPPNSTINPNVIDVFDSWVGFITEFGYDFMLSFVRHIPSGDIASCFICLPNPFDNKSMVIYSWVVSKKYRGKGLSWLMLYETAIRAENVGIVFGSALFEKTHEITPKMGKRLHANVTRVHLVLEYHL